MWHVVVGKSNVLRTEVKSIKIKNKKDTIKIEVHRDQNLN